MFNYRFERKFFISEFTIEELEFLIKLHPAVFSEIYHARYVNNIYFDSFNYKNYFDSINGLSDRVKFRIRWYGNLFGNIEKPTLEKKIKKSLLGKKELFNLKSFTMDSNFTIETIAKVLNESDVPDVNKIEMKSLNPILCSRYKRKYFQSSDRKYRFTVDSDLIFYRMQCRNNLFLCKLYNNVNIILELKYDIDSDNNAKMITNYFPFRMTKSSKYTEGIEQLYL